MSVDWLEDDDVHVVIWYPTILGMQEGAWTMSEVRWRSLDGSENLCDSSECPMD